MELDSVLADAELNGDGFVWHAAGDEIQHLSLPGGKLVMRVALRELGLPPRDSSARRERGVDHGQSLGDRKHRGMQGFAIDLSRKQGDRPGRKIGQLDENSLNNEHPVSYTHLRAHETDSYLVC